MDASDRTFAVVVNPTKFSDREGEKVRERIETTAHTTGWQPPIWLETTVEDPGRGQAAQALGEGADVVCALGGDGTVRSVATALVGSGVPLGLLPGGTGNLLARNLAVPVDDLEMAVQVALTGADRTIDVGRIGVDLLENEDSDPRTARKVEEYFLIMAGMGFDASMIADAPEDLKAQIGAAAYVVSGMKHLRGNRFVAQLWTDGGPRRTVKARTILFANVGEIQGGIELAPADPDDGLLDCLVLSPKALAGWVGVATHFITRGRQGSERVQTSKFRQMSLRLQAPQHLQLDGDVIGLTANLDVEVVPDALTVRVTE